MQVLDNDSQLVYISLLIEEMPSNVLEFLSLSPKEGATEGGIIGFIKQRLPSSIGVEEVHDQCREIIRWFMHNGDIEQTNGNRYILIPTYIIRIESAQNQTVYKVCGDLRTDSLFSNHLGARRDRYQFQVVQHKWKKNNAFDLPLYIGLRRTVICASENQASFEEFVHEKGISLISPQEITDTLPSISRLMLPPRDAYKVIPPSWGIWFIYRPANNRLDRWGEIKNWLDSDVFSILRWQSSDDWRGEQSARFFLRQGNERLHELSPSTARLWMFYQDQQNHNNKNFWVVDKTIWVPLEIPHPHQQWLQLISSSWERLNNLRKYSLIGKPEEEAASILQSTLAIIPRFDFPAKEGD